MQAQAAAAEPASSPALPHFEDFEAALKRKSHEQDAEDGFEADAAWYEPRLRCWIAMTMSPLGALHTMALPQTATVATAFVHGLVVACGTSAGGVLPGACSDSTPNTL